MTTPEATPEPSHLLDLFQQLVPRARLDVYDTGHGGIFASWVVLWLMIVQRLHHNASLARAVAELKFGAISRFLPDCQRVRQQTISANTGGYCQARQNLPIEAAMVVADLIFDHLAATQPPAWRGRRAFLIDGSTASMTHQPELVDRFPPQANQYGASHWPILRFVVAHELASGAATRPEWGAMSGPEAQSETALARRLLERLGPPAMIVGDRNFGIFALAAHAVRAGHDVLLRLTDSRFEALLRQATPTGPGQWSLRWRPSRWDRQSTAELPAETEVVGRLVEVMICYEGKTIRLLLFTTDLEATPEELAALYRRRWEIETDLRALKQTLRLDRLSGKSVEIVEKELILGIVTYNLVVQVRRLAAARVDLEPRRLSFSRVLSLVQAFCGGLWGLPPERWNEQFDRLLDAAAQCRLPQRKRPRSYPREVIPRRRTFPRRQRISEQKN
jgi:hypothetical protein